MKHLSSTWKINQLCSNTQRDSVSSGERTRKHIEIYSLLCHVPESQFIAATGTWIYSTQIFGKKKYGTAFKGLSREVVVDTTKILGQVAVQAVDRGSTIVRNLDRTFAEPR